MEIIVILLIFITITLYITFNGLLTFPGKRLHGSHFPGKDVSRKDNQLMNLGISGVFKGGGHWAMPPSPEKKCFSA